MLKIGATLWSLEWSLEFELLQGGAGRVCPTVTWKDVGVQGLFW